MFQVKKLLKYCRNDEIAVSVIKHQRNVSFVDMLISFIMIFVIISALYKIEVNSFFDGFCFVLLLFMPIPAGMYFIVKLGKFCFLEFDDIETDYINCVLLDNAKIEEFAVLRKDNSYVYILDEYKRVKQIPFCSPEKHECKEHIKIKRYLKLEDMLLKEFYEPI